MARPPQSRKAPKPATFNGSRRASEWISTISKRMMITVFTASVIPIHALEKP